MSELVSFLGKQLSIGLLVGLLWRDASYLNLDPMCMRPAFWGKAGGDKRYKKQESLMLSGKAGLPESLAAIMLNWDQVERVEYE